MGNGINKILPDLYLGNIKDGINSILQLAKHEKKKVQSTSVQDARDPELLAQHNITHILSIHDTAAPVLEVRELLVDAAVVAMHHVIFSPEELSALQLEVQKVLKVELNKKDMTYLCISASDHSKQNLIQYFRESIVFIHESRLKGEGCLVHCMAGVSRSVTLVVAYIMTVTGRGWVESLAAVRSARPCAGPNLGFLRQLEEFENIELAQYRAWWMERYGKNSFNDDEEVQNLLNQKSAKSNNDAVTTSITGTT